MTEVKITIVTEESEEVSEQGIRNALRAAGYDISEIVTEDITEQHSKIVIKTKEGLYVE